MSKFRVGMSKRFMQADGTSAIPEFDFAGLLDNPQIDSSVLPLGDLTPVDLDGLDAVVLALEGISADSFPADDRLTLVARFGVGYDRIDVAACTAHRAALAITPDGVRRPVAVAVMAFMLGLTTKMFVKDALTRESPGGWERRGQHPGVGLVGRRVGSVGIGNIGAEVFRLAKPFDMNFIAHDPYADPAVAASLGIKLTGLEEVFAKSDVVTIHCPLTDATRGLVGEHLLSLMQPTAYLINTSRGPVVDQAALTRALTERRIAGAGIDVLEQEPPDPDEPILKLDNVILAPHALCWTDQCIAGLGGGDVQAVRAVMQGRAPDHVVNRDVLRDPAFAAKLAAYLETFG